MFGRDREGQALTLLVDGHDDFGVRAHKGLPSGAVFGYNCLLVVAPMDHLARCQFLLLYVG